MPRGTEIESISSKKLKGWREENDGIGAEHCNSEIMNHFVVVVL